MYVDEMLEPFPVPERRRIFVAGNDGAAFYLFEIVQERKDGSLYLSDPDFKNSRWLEVIDREGKPQLQVVESPGEGKFSIHPDGRTHIRDNQKPGEHPIRIRGSLLIDRVNNTCGVRHLLTVFPRKPYFQPHDSSVFNRKSDQLLQSKEALVPFNVILFAIPGEIRRTNCRFIFDQNDLAKIPEDFMGWGQFRFPYHQVAWFMYKTKSMDQWPKHSYYHFHDGSRVPVFIGSGNNEMDVALCQPTYQVRDNVLSIVINAGFPQ